MPQPSPLVPPGLLAFSFKYYNATHARFGLHKGTNEYPARLLDRLRDLSADSWMGIVTKGNNKTLRVHKITWEGTTEPRGFQLKGDLSSVDAWQFSLSANQYGRVHGFVIASVFYIVWLDPSHALYA